MPKIHYNSSLLGSISEFNFFKIFLHYELSVPLL